MSNNKEEFDVLKVVELARYKKYEVTSAGFAVIDKLDKIAAIPKKLKTRKNAVQALHVLSEGMLKYDYFTSEERKKLIQEAGMSDAPFKGGPKGLFSSSAPVTEDDNDEESIPDEDVKSAVSFSDDDDYEEDADFEEEEEEAFEEDEEEEEN